MKKLFFFVVLCITTITASAQVKSVDVKGELRHNFGAGIGVTAGITDRIDFAPSFNWYFPGKDRYAFSVEGDFHYNLPLDIPCTVYPLLGIAFWNQGGKAEVNNWTRLGMDIGAGVKYEIVDRVDVFLEAKYQWFNKYDYSYFSVGFNFGI